MILLFWVLVGLILYAYVGYPLLLGLLALIMGRRPELDHLPPHRNGFVTVRSNVTAAPSPGAAGCPRSGRAPTRMGLR